MCTSELRASAYILSLKKEEKKKKKKGSKPGGLCILHARTMMHSQKGSRVRLQCDDHKHTHNKKSIRVKNTQKWTEVCFWCLYYSANSIIHKTNCRHDEFTNFLLPKLQIIP